MNNLTGLVALTCLLAAGSAGAVCVSTTNDLAVALQQAETTPLSIQLVKGSYRLDQTPWGNPNAFAAVKPGTTIVGGYVAGCASRDIDPTGTVLTDDGSAPAYEVYPDGDLTLDSLTFNLANTLFLYAGSYSADATVSVRHAIFNGSGANARLGLYWYGGSGTNGTVRVVDSLFRGSSASWCGFGAVAVTGRVNYYLVNDTAANNGYGLCLFDETQAALARFFVYNSIAFDNSDFDLWADTTSVTLVDDTIGMQTVPDTLSPTPIGTKTGDPQLDAGYHPIAPGSPSIDTGTTIVPGGLPDTDLAGNPRVVGGGIDRGAYESAYDNSTVQTVTNTNDSGAGSLRAAIHNANLTAGANSIHFAIGSDCSPVKVIQVDSNLEAIGGDTTINGYTQPGASRNTLDTGDNANICVILEPSAASTATDGLRVASGAGNGVNLTVAGLAIGGFPQDGVSLLGGSAHNVNGSHFGGTVNGHALGANGVDVRIGAGVHDVTVGGDGAGQRNIIGGAANAGVHVGGGATPAHDNEIVNNYIGIGWGTGFTNRGNGGSGVYLAGANNTVTANLIGNNGADGVDVDNTAASGNTVTHNTLGGDGVVAFANGLAGVRVENGANDNTINANTIAGNTNAGVRIVSGVHNTIRKNAIFDNGGLGVDLAGAGVTPNDDDGAVVPADYANHGQNFPVLSAAAGGHFQGRVSGTLTTLPGTYTVDLYLQAGCDASGFGEGGRWLGSGSVTVPAPMIGDQGTGTFVLAVGVRFPATFSGQYVTATATGASGNTSEFSACTGYVDDTIFVAGFDDGSS